jgi:hypothetical protein
MKVNYLILLLLFCFNCNSSKHSYKNESFYDGIKTKNDYIKTHGDPDFKYYGISTNEIWAYNDSIKGGVHSITFADSIVRGHSWSLNFNLPDTTESVFFKEAPELPFYQYLTSNQCLIKHTDDYNHEAIIKFNLNDSIGGITRNSSSSKINVLSIVKTLKEHPIHKIGCIKKNANPVFFHMGFVQIWVKENNSTFYSSMITLNWYDKRFESVMQEIWKLI